LIIVGRRLDAQGLRQRPSGLSIPEFSEMEPETERRSGSPILCPVLTSYSFDAFSSVCGKCAGVATITIN
jgi:hypothetical protein